MTVGLVTVSLCGAASDAVTALVPRVPVPVQPMKAMAVAIIGLGLSGSVVSAGGIEIALPLRAPVCTPLARYPPAPQARSLHLTIKGRGAEAPAVTPA